MARLLVIPRKFGVQHRSMPRADFDGEQDRQVHASVWRGVGAAIAIIIGCYAVAATPAFSPPPELARDVVQAQQLQTDAYVWQILAEEPEPPPCKSPLLEVPVGPLSGEGRTAPPQA